MDDELPRHLFHTSGSIPTHPTRKRLRHDSFNAPSSDPPIFSSDDNADADNYLHGRDQRSKKKFRGPWYQQEVLHSDTGSQDGLESNLPPQKTERKFERKYDSGVYMASDGTEMEDEFLGNAAGNGVPAATFPSRQSITASRSQPNISPEEIWVQAQIHSCLERSDERIDLSNQGLSKITNATIRPLATFTVIPPVSQDVFHHLEPNLKIFLSTNKLTSLPEELFSLERLTALSLRGNELQELPPAIGKLTNLKELNISLNRLKYLPFEILDLFQDTCHLRSFSIHPNPFLQPPRSSWEMSDLNLPRKRRNAIAQGFIPKTLRRSWSAEWMVSFRARSDVRYFDKFGTLVKGPVFEPQAEIPLADMTIDPKPPISESFTSRAPSLVEVALRRCHQSPQLSQLPDMLPEGLEGPRSLLDQAVAQKESGVGKCTICEREFMIKRTEWIEWWEISTRDVAETVVENSLARNERDVFESKVPLVRRGCSWFCVPGKMEADDEGVMDIER